MREFLPTDEFFIEGRGTIFFFQKDREQFVNEDLPKLGEVILVYREPYLVKDIEVMRTSIPYPHEKYRRFGASVTRMQTVFRFYEEFVRAK